MTALRDRIDAIRAGVDARPDGPLPQSRTIGLFAWSTTRRYDDDSPVGGIVVEVMDGHDPDTGEAGTWLRTIDPYRARPVLTWHVLDEGEVDRATVAPADAFTLAAVIRRLCEEVAMRDQHRQRGRGRCPAEHVTLIAYAHRLAGAL